MNDAPDNVIHVAFGVDGQRGKRLDRPAAVVPPPENEPRPLRARSKDVAEGLYALGDAARVVGLPEARLRAWARAKVVTPSARAQERGRARRYTFQDLIGLRAARGLLERGVPDKRIREAVRELRASLPRVTRPLAELRIVADGHTVVVREGGLEYEPQTGQLVLDFRVQSLRDDVVRVLRDEKSERHAAYAAYLEGCRLDEDDLTLDRAEAAYRKAIELDGSLASAYTNLGNLRFRRGHAQEAEQLYRAALLVDQDQPEALYNLGFLAWERAEIHEAARLFAAAIDKDPGFADAHFNLAMALEDLGHQAQARARWESYLRLDPQGPWAEIARRHLS